MTVEAVAAVVAAGAFGAAAGTLLPGVIARVPAGGPVLARPAPAEPRRALLAAGCAALCAALAAGVGPSADLPAHLFLAWAGIALAVIDLDCHRLPDALTLPSYPIGAALLGAAALAEADAGGALRALAGMAALGGFYYLLAQAHPAGLGFGDVKLAGVLGLYLGWAGWGALAVGTFVAFAASALVGLALVLTRRATLKTSIPFGPFMVAGAVLGILAGDAVSDWYVG